MKFQDCNLRSSTENMQEGYRNGLSKTALEFEKLKQELPACFWAQTARNPFHYTITPQILLAKCNDWVSAKRRPKTKDRKTKTEHRKTRTLTTLLPAVGVTPLYLWVCLHYTFAVCNSILRCLTTCGPSSHLEKKPTINSWKRHVLCDSVLSYERNRWKIWLICSGKYFEIWIFYTFYHHWLTAMV